MKHPLLFPASKLLLGLLVVMIAVSCSQDQNTAQQTAGAPQVPVQKVVNTQGRSNNSYSAAIEGTTNVEIRPQVSGYLRQILVDEGAYVKAGQLLFKIDDRPYLEQYNTAKAAVAVAESNLKSLKIDLDKKIELVENKIVSDLQVQQAAAAYEGAQASLQQAKAALNAVKINLDFCTIVAPVSGYIGRIPFRLGSLVNASSVEPLTLLTDINQVYGYFSMSEADFVNFQEQRAADNATDSVTLFLSNGRTYAHKGLIDAVTGQFDKNTGSISIRAKFNNPDRTLRAGNTGKIRITRTLNDVLSVPIRATTSIQDKIYVYKVDKENKIEQAEILVTGKTTEDYFVSAGVAAGETIVVGGLGMIRPGMVVSPQLND